MNQKHCFEEKCFKKIIATDRKQLAVSFRSRVTFLSFPVAPERARFRLIELQMQPRHPIREGL